MKTEPSTFSVTDLMNSPHKTTHWEGVRNYQARNFMRDEMKVGDQVLCYHSNCKQPGVVASCKVTKEAYPDHTAQDKNSDYYDPKSKENNRWVMVDVTWQETFKHEVSLNRIKETKGLQNMKLIQKGNRLSILPLTKAEYNLILKMGAKPL